MPRFTGATENEHSEYVQVAASQTTAQVSRSGDATAGRDYLHHLIVVRPSSTPGAVTVFDGGTTLIAIPAGAGDGTLPYTLPIGVTCRSTKGFNITTGASVAVVAVGRFGV
jgi:hypothetical protein